MWKSNETWAKQPPVRADQPRKGSRVIFVPVLTLTLLLSYAYFAPGKSLRAVAAQSAPPTGAYGWVANGYQIDSAGQNSAALVGLMNFDGAGNVSGTVTLKPRNPNLVANASVFGTGTFTGTYSSNPDGTITAKLAFSFGFTLTFAMVVTDGGQGLQFVSTDTSGGTVATFRGASPQSLSGGLPIGLFFGSANGGIPISLTGVTAAGGGPTVYTAAPATGSGPAQCRDGSTGTWTASLSSLTFVIDGFSSPGIGNFLAAVIGSVCGNRDFETLSGLALRFADPAGATTMTLQGSGSVVSGTARVAQAGGSLNGSYGVQLNYSPFPAGTVGVMQFDGAGNVTASLTDSGIFANQTGANGTTAFTGTYTLNPDGAGTINLKSAPGGVPAPSFSFVMTDGGSQLLLLRTGNSTFDVAFGTARLQ